MDFGAHTELGRTGLRVSRLCVGASYGVPSRALEYAFHEGRVNFFYWGALRRKGMGEAIRHLARTERDKIVVALQSYDHMGYVMRAFLHRGLKALHIDCADILILGGYNRTPRDRVLDEAQRLRDQGKVRFLAISGHNRTLFGDLAPRDDLPIDVFMLRYNAAHRGAEDDVFPHLPVHNRPGVMAFTATCWGNLIKGAKMPPGETPLTPSQCYRFVLSNPHVDVCQTGPRSAREMEEALLTLEEGPLSGEEMERAVRIGEYVYRSRKR